MPQMWFGTRGYERWIKMPKPDVDMPYTRRFNRTDQANGGATLLQSDSGHREYSFEWNGRIDEMEQISTYVDGVYDTDANGGLLYFLDPSANTRNHFPALWAAPYLCGLDAPSLVKDARPTLSQTPSAGFGVPARTATFTVGASSPIAKLYIPIPPGHEARFALYGPSAQSAKYTTAPVTAGVAGATMNRNILANSAYGTGLTVVSGVDGIEFALKQGAGSVAVTAGLLLIVPTGYSAPAPNFFTAGKGNSGCRIDGVPSRVIHTVADDINWASYAAHLVEVGAWL